MKKEMQELIDRIHDFDVAFQEYFLNGKTNAALYKMLDAKMKMDFAVVDVEFEEGVAAIIKI